MGGLDRDTYAAVQPDENLLVRRRVGRREEPEEKVVLVVGVAADGQQPGIGLANVEVDIRDALAIDSEFYDDKLAAYSWSIGATEHSLVVFAFKNLCSFSSRSTTRW
jgi:hypothetical protein